MNKGLIRKHTIIVSFLLPWILGTFLDHLRYSLVVSFTWDAEDDDDDDNDDENDNDNENGNDENDNDEDDNTKNYSNNENDNTTKTVMPTIMTTTTMMTKT